MDNRIKVEFVAKSMDWENIVKKEEPLDLPDESLTVCSSVQSVNDLEVKDDLLLKEEIKGEAERLFSEKSPHKRGRTSFEIDFSESFIIKCSDIPIKEESLPGLDAHLLPSGDASSPQHVKTETFSDDNDTTAMNDSVTSVSDVPVLVSLKEDQDSGSSFSEIQCDGQSIRTCPDEDESCVVKEEEEFVEKDPLCMFCTDQDSCEETDPLLRDSDGECINKSCTGKLKINDAGIQSMPSHNKDRVGNEGNVDTLDLLHCSFNNLKSKENFGSGSGSVLGNMKHNCKACRKNFNTPSLLQYHMTLHTGEKPVKCTLCEKSFRQRDDLAHHMKTHTEENPFSCKLCEKPFNRHSALSCHMRTHTGEKPFSCKLCEKSFRHSGSLACHMRTHTGEKPFSCKLCEKSFSRRGDLRCHMRTHTGEKPFRCKLCEKSFRHSGDLARHMRTHTGEKSFRCKLCEKSFSSSSSLSCHVRTHTGEKPFRCKLCEKSFTRRSVLARHVDIHTGEQLVPSMSNIAQSISSPKDSGFVHCQSNILLTPIVVLTPIIMLTLDRRPIIS